MSRSIRLCTLLAASLALVACGNSPTGPSAAISCSANSVASANCTAADFVNPHADFVNPHADFVNPHASVVSPSE